MTLSDDAVKVRPWLGRPPKPREEGELERECTWSVVAYTFESKVAVGIRPLLRLTIARCRVGRPLERGTMWAGREQHGGDILDAHHTVAGGKVLHDAACGGFCVVALNWVTRQCIASPPEHRRISGGEQ